jgi:hypothetical protein
MIRATRLKRTVAGCFALVVFVAASSRASAQAERETAQVADIKVTFAHPTDTAPFGGGLPREAQFPPGFDSKEHGTFGGIVAHRISALRLTWSETTRFKTEGQAEDLLRQLLSSPNTETWTYRVWSFVDVRPSMVVTVEHVAGKQGMWVVWCPPPGLY